jgi:hypothetical protein
MVTLPHEEMNIHLSEPEKKNFISRALNSLDTGLNYASYATIFISPMASAAYHNIRSAVKHKFGSPTKFDKSLGLKNALVYRTLLAAGMHLLINSPNGFETYQIKQEVRSITPHYAESISVEQQAKYFNEDMGTKMLSLLPAYRRNSRLPDTTRTKVSAVLYDEDNFSAMGPQAYDFSFYPEGSFTLDDVANMQITPDLPHLEFRKRLDPDTWDVKNTDDFTSINQEKDEFFARLEE